jgi:hypothetical protein
MDNRTSFLIGFLQHLMAAWRLREAMGLIDRYMPFDEEI